MCLITKQIEPIILEKDMMVYKMVQKVSHLGLISAFSDFPIYYIKDKVNFATIVYADKSEGFCWLSEVDIRLAKTKLGTDDKQEIIEDQSIIIIKQGLHSFTSPEMVDYYLGGFDKDRSPIIECTIPKGSEVYYSVFDGILVSNVLKMNKIL